MIEGLVAKRYAEAMFEVTKQKDLLDRVEQDLLFVLDVVKGTEDLMVFLRHPQIDEQVKKSILDSAFTDSITQIVKNFLYQLIDGKRIEYLEEITNYYIKLANEARGIVNVEAITSVDLSAADKKKVIEQLNKQLNKEIRLDNKVDPSILGGMVIRIGDRVYDGSISKQLKVLKRSLTASRV